MHHVHTPFSTTFMRIVYSMFQKGQLIFPTMRKSLETISYALIAFILALKSQSNLDSLNYWYSEKLKVRKFLLLSPAKNASGVRETILKTFDSPYYFASFKSRTGGILFYILIQKFASNSSCKRLRSPIGPVFPQNWSGLYLSRKFCSTSDLAKLYRFAGNMKIEI